jgi:hypothetical protein
MEWGACPRRGTRIADVWLPWFAASLIVEGWSITLDRNVGHDTPALNHMRCMRQELFIGRLPFFTFRTKADTRERFMWPYDSQ